MSNQPAFNFSSTKTGPVECLGQTFPSEDARREHYLKLLAAKLKDSEFRKTEGFPLGTDDAILALSDPPYYTACPNPWLSGFIEHYGTLYDPKKPYHREPFAADVSEGKNHPIYGAHSYHTKVPHRAIMKYILHYTQPGDVVFDGFCGTGMTGVAAKFCGDSTEIQALGYRIKDDGTILDEEGKAISKIGARRVIINDLSPIASFIAYNYNVPVDADAFERAATQLLKEVENELGWMYETKHTDGSKRRIDFTVWSEVFTCPECGGELTFTEEATDEETKGVKEKFPCPHCSATLTKRKLERVFEATLDSVTKTPWKRVKFKPCLIQYRVGKEKFEKTPDTEDLAILARIEQLSFPDSIPCNKWPIEEMYHGSRLEPKGFNRTHQMFILRAAQSLGLLWEKARKFRNGRIRQMLLFFVEQANWTMSRLNRYRPTGYSQVNQYLTGVYYLAAQHAECSPWYTLDGKAKRLASVFSLFPSQNNRCAISTMSAGSIAAPDGCLDYIFTDPPFGENIPYADLNLMIESWHGVATATANEAIIDEPKGKQLSEYQELMHRCFREYYRLLKPGRWMTVEFSNSQASVWNAIQTSLQQAGFVVANVAALDKQQRSFRSVTTATAVKQDLVISAYKPNGGLEARFAKHGTAVAGVWDFVRTHLKNLPVVKAKGGQLVPIAERDPRILYDRTIAFYLGHSTPVPLSSAEFQVGLGENFVERDEKWYLPEQAHLYDQKRLQMDSVGQLAIFVEDERSAIDWVRQYLKNRPSTLGDLTPEFMQQLNASWKKWEARPELRVLLDQNFLCYDGVGEVPSQIHSYLSTQFKELRNLAKDSPQLRQKGKDRWYVPDPKKNIDVETLRNKRLLEEFWRYLPEGFVSAARTPDKTPTLPGMTTATPRPKVPRSKKLREVRTEAIRAGFKYCYQLKDYATILAVADMLPDSVLNEDEQLQMLYDNAALRSGASAG